MMNGKRPRWVHSGPSASSRQRVLEPGDVVLRVRGVPWLPMAAFLHLSSTGILALRTVLALLPETGVFQVPYLSGRYLWMQCTSPMEMSTSQ